jgi:RNA polymerase sigma factor (sigma-70 family)
MAVFFMPDPDTPLEALITRAQSDASNDSPAMCEIIRRFEGLAQHLGRVVSRAPECVDDGVNGARWGLVQAVRAHREGTPGFPNFASLYMKGEARRCARAASSSEIPMSDEFLDRPAAQEADSGVDLDSAFRVLSQDQRSIAFAHFVEDQPLTQIALVRGVSVSAVSQRLATVRRTLRSVIAEQIAA